MKNLTRKPETARKSQDELETLKKEHAQNMDINRALGKELAPPSPPQKKTKKHSDLESRLKYMAGYNQEGQKLGSSHQTTPIRRKETERVPGNLTNSNSASNSRLQDLAENNPGNLNQKRAAEAANKPKKCLTYGSISNHKIKHCDSNRKIYARDKNGTLTKKLTQDTLRKEQIKSIRLCKKYKNEVEAKEVFISFKLEQAATQTMEDIGISIDFFSGLAVLMRADIARNL